MGGCTFKPEGGGTGNGGTYKIQYTKLVDVLTTPVCLATSLQGRYCIQKCTGGIGMVARVGTWKGVEGVH